MKAIQIKYLPPTEKKSSRLKAFSDKSKSLIEQYYDNSENDTVRILNIAKNFMTKMEWNAEITGMGTLNNGNWVVTIA